MSNKTDITRHQVLEILKQVIDPEIGINIVDLGLIYRVEIFDDRIEIDYTLTYPGCPLEEVIRGDIHQAVSDTWDDREVVTEAVWQPLWHEGLMSDEAKLMMGYPI